MTSSVYATSPAASQHKGGQDLQKVVDEKDNTQTLWNNGHHHHHHHRRKHHKNKYHCNHKPRHKNGKCPGLGSTIGLVCNGKIIDELFCKNPVDLAFADVSTENNGGISKNRYVLVKPPCSSMLPPGCEAVAEDVSLEESQNDVYDDDATDAYADDDADTNANDIGRSEADAESSPAEMPDGLPEEEQSFWKKEHHRHHHRSSKCKHDHNGNNGTTTEIHPYRDLCVDIGKFCGDQLYGCDFPKNKLYFCEKVGESPVEIPDLENKCSRVIPPDEPCVCSGFESQPVCGRQLPESCKADPDTMYNCPPTKGALPIPVERCRGSQGCAIGSSGAICLPTKCVCQSKGGLCSSELSEICGLEKNTVYACNGEGTVPEYVRSCGEGLCAPSIPTVSTNSSQGVFATAEATCSAPCTCKDSNDFCSSSLPASCGFGPAQILQCSGLGSAPTIKSDCKLFSKGHVVCATITNGAICTQPGCACPSDRATCGSQFPAVCGYAANTLYKCSAVGAMPEEQQACGDGWCIPVTEAMSEEDTEDIFGATEAICVPRCSCPGSSDICGSTLPPECGFGNKTILDCNGFGSTPIAKDECSGSTVCATSPNGTVCLPQECTCTSNSPACGSRFPESCQYDKNVIYACNAPGAVPQFQHDCSASGTEACAALFDGDQCLPKELVPEALTRMLATRNLDALSNVAAGELVSTFDPTGNIPLADPAFDPLVTALQALVDALRTGSAAAIQTAVSAVNAQLDLLMLDPAMSSNPTLLVLKVILRSLSHCPVAGPMSVAP
ncbi:hypothetical protein BGZ73_001528 [Actinomortierella ambigua]|nr:hypothetical protein BGZ73_001528 [Actinomortierella ambigua]